MKSFKKIPFVLGLMAMAASASAQKSSGFHVTGNFPIKSNGGWDYITVDGPGKRLFISHASQVNVLSLKGDSVGVIASTNGVHGIALVPELNKGYTSNGKDNNCTVFDLATLKPLAQIPVGTNPDAIFHDESTKKVYVFNGRSMDASVIDPATDNVVATIPLGGKPEAGVSDGKGHVFVNLETTNEVVKIDSKTYKVIGRYKLEGGEEPSGLAIDRATNRLFVGCGGNGQMLVVNSLTGKTMAKFKIGDCDGVAFDPALKLAFSSNREGTLSVVQEVSADKFVQLANVTTELSARTLALDPLTHKIYLPAAKVEEVKATADNPKARPHQIPGTFHVIEVSK